MTRDFGQDLKMGKYKNEDVVTDVVGYVLEGVPYGIPINASIELRKYITAAVLKYKNPEENFEEIISQLNLDDLSDEKNVTVHDIVTHCISRNVEIVAQVINDLQKNLKDNIQNINLGESLFFMAMIRLKESFKSCIILIRNGFYVEVITVLRLIYEQLCWAIFVIDEKSEEVIKKNKTSANTKFLKEKINEEYGKLYGILSEEAHLAPNTIFKYLSNKDDEIYILGRSSIKCKEEVISLLQLYKIYIEVFSYSVNKHFNLCTDDKSYYNDFINFQFLLCTELAQNLKDDISTIKIVEKV